MLCWFLVLDLSSGERVLGSVSTNIIVVDSRSDEVAVSVGVDHGIHVETTKETARSAG